MTTELKQVMAKLDDIKAELDLIKQHIMDPDTILTEDDLQSIRDAERDLKEGKTISHEKLKKELGL